jgi:hypothetical protein
LNHPTHSLVRDFWLLTCKYDTHHRSAGHAQLDTPWNYFSPENILVCTLWCDNIAEVDDGGVTRRFISLGGKMDVWRGPGVQHGEQAEANLMQALSEKSRIVGYEAEPSDVGESRRVRHFYMDRAHELIPVFGITGEDLIDRLDLRAALQARCPQLESAIRPGIVFELEPVRGPMPGGGVPAVPTSTPPQAQPDPNLGAGITERYAQVALPCLVAHVRSQVDGVLPTLTYGQLAEAIGWFDKNEKPHARGMGQVLHRVMELIDSVGAKWQEQLPFLTTVVVAATGDNRGLPEAGIEARWPGYEGLTRPEKQARVLAEYTRLLQFGPLWEQVLAELGLSQGEPDRNRTKGGGESAAHRALKEYVLSHPAEFGAEFGQFAQAEYALRSGDTVDVFFRSPREWIGVEVKSRVSDRMVEDYERGIYQVIKYRAVLQAQACADQPSRPPSVRVLLVLEGALPPVYRDLARRFNVDVREHVGPGAVC